MYESDPIDQYLGQLSQDLLQEMIVATETGSGMTREEAVAVVLNANARHEDRFWSGEPEHPTVEIESIINDLVNRGFLYEAGGELRVTDREVLKELKQSGSHSGASSSSPSSSEERY